MRYGLREPLPHQRDVGAQNDGRREVLVTGDTNHVLHHLQRQLEPRNGSRWHVLAIPQSNTSRSENASAAAL